MVGLNDLTWGQAMRLTHTWCSMLSLQDDKNKYLIREIRHNDEHVTQEKETRLLVWSGISAFTLSLLSVGDIAMKLRANIGIPGLYMTGQVRHKAYSIGPE